MATTVSTNRPSWLNSKTLLAVMGAIIIILVLVIVFLGGVAAGHHSSNLEGRRGTAHMGPRLLGPPETSGSRGLLGSSQDVVIGAVTSVSGDGFTVAGGGTTTQVKTLSSTQFKGASGVKVNDTVLASGRKSGDTLQADRVVVNPLKGL